MLRQAEDLSSDQQKFEYAVEKHVRQCERCTPQEPCLYLRRYVRMMLRRGLAEPMSGNFSPEVRWMQSPKWQAKRPSVAVAARMLNLREIEQAYGLSEHQVYHWVNTYQLHAVMIGKRWHYPQWEIEDLLAGQATSKRTRIELGHNGGGAPVKATKDGHSPFDLTGELAA